MDHRQLFSNVDLSSGQGDHGTSEVKGYSPTASSSLLTRSILHSSMEDIHHQKSYGGQQVKKSSAASSSTPASSASSDHFRSSDQELMTPSKVKPKISLTKRATVNRGVGTEAENGALYKYIQEEKRAVLLRKVITTFLCGGLRKTSQKLNEAEEQRKLKEVECAARMIMNTLLLNSWRQDKQQLTKLLHENAQLTISVENLTLQLRVLRHLQGQEKDRANEKVTEIRNLKTQVANAQKSLKNSENDLASIQEELRYCREDNQKLTEQKTFLHKELEELIAEKSRMVETVETERRRASRTEEECRITKAEYTDLRKQVKDFSAQSFQWRERSRTLETQGIQIQENLDLRETSLRLLESNFKLLLSEREQLELNKKSLEDACSDMQKLLNAEISKSESLKRQYETTMAATESQEEKLAALEESLLILRNENQKTMKELYWHKLRNVRSRRAWVNAVESLSSPTKLIKYLLFGGETSNEAQEVEE